SKVDYNYNSDGLLSKVNDNGTIVFPEWYSLGRLKGIYHTDGAIDPIETYADYTRGQAKTITKPEGVTIKREVNGDGTTNSITNGNRHKTSYAYDGLARTTNITPP